MSSAAPTLAIVGGGPAGLMAAETAAQARVAVTIYDRMPSLGRKVLLAGRGGLNLTHSEPLDRFLARYGDARERLAPLIEAFPPAALRAFAQDLGEDAFVGSSGRVFPKSFKTSPLLRAWLRRLAAQGVVTRLRHAFAGWDEDGALRFATPDGETRVRADATVLAMGGASWPRLGSDGAWIDALASAGVAVAPLRPANCGFDAAWSPLFRDRFAGTPLKSILVRHGGAAIRGECMATRRGLEGGVVYALAARLRDAIERDGGTTLHIDLRPDVSLETLTQRLSRPRAGQSTATFLRKAAGLAPIAIGLLREAGAIPHDPPALAALIKTTPVRLIAAQPLDRAISTAGGVRFGDLDEGLMLERRPGVFVAGEMLDWEAPTGGYLLQACFATGRAAGAAAARYVGARG